MGDWNVVVTVREGGFVKACRLLGEFGQVRKTDFFNTLIMRAADPYLAMELLHARLGEEPAIAAWIARFLPLQRTFNFHTVAEFEARAREGVSDWLPRLAGARFHVRMHRRGFKGKLSSAEEERFLDTFLLEKLAEAGTPGKVAFEEPEAIIAVETLGPRAGLSIWGKEELARFPLLHLD